MKAFNVAGTFFQVRAKQYWFKQRAAGNFDFLREAEITGDAVR